jgi:nucleolar protein 9
LIRTVVERCDVRGIETEKLAKALENVYGGHNGFDIARLLKLADPAVEKLKPNAAKPTGANGEHSGNFHSEKLHGSLLAQAMIASPGPLSDLIFDSLARLGASLSLSAARAPSASHAITASLASPNASIIFRRKMIQQFYGHVGEMALDPSASHVIDAVWEGTHGLAFIRERIAEELAENEASLRESHAGRKVWRNWRMDLYKKRRREWIVASRESAGREGFVGFPGDSDAEKESSDDAPTGSHSSGKHKHKRKDSKGKEREKNKNAPNEQVERHLTALERARQKHAQEKQRKEREAARAAKHEKKHNKEEKAEQIAVA